MAPVEIIRGSHKVNVIHLLNENTWHSSTRRLFRKVPGWSLHCSRECEPVFMKKGQKNNIKSGVPQRKTTITSHQICISYFPHKNHLNACVIWVQIPLWRIWRHLPRWCIHVQTQHGLKTHTHTESVNPFGRTELCGPLLIQSGLLDCVFLTHVMYYSTLAPN